MGVTTARILDTRRKRKKKDTFPLAIRVTANRVPVSFPIGIELSVEDFKKLKAPRIGEGLSKIRETIIQEEQRAKTIIDTMGTFTFQAFREEFNKNKPAKRRKSTANHNSLQVDSPQSNPEMASNSGGKNKKYGKRKYDRIRSNVDYIVLGPLAVAFGAYIKQLEAQQRIGTAESYFSSLMSLLNFKKCLRVEDITVDFLYRYEQWMLSRNNTYTTIGIYLRPLRAILNIQKEDELLSPKKYPFGKRKYQIPTGTNPKKALELSDIKKIYDYQPQTNIETEMYARDIWLFGYYCNGINTKDIACLKYKNIEDDFIIIQREKTKFTTRANPKIITIPINDEIIKIIDRWGNQDKDSNNYIFPVLRHGLSPHRKYELVQAFTSVVNDWMKKIAKNLSIDKKVTTIVYRHSFSTVLKRSGVSTEFISEALGHTDLKTTENYLDSFEKDIKKKFAAKLIAFDELRPDLKI